MTTLTDRGGLAVTQRGPIADIVGVAAACVLVSVGVERRPAPPGRGHLPGAHGRGGGRGRGGRDPGGRRRPAHRRSAAVVDRGRPRAVLPDRAAVGHGGRGRAGRRAPRVPPGRLPRCARPPATGHPAAAHPARVGRLGAAAGHRAARPRGARAAGEPGDAVAGRQPGAHGRRPQRVDGRGRRVRGRRVPPSQPSPHPPGPRPRGARGRPAVPGGGRDRPPRRRTSCSGACASSGC